METDGEQVEQKTQKIMYLCINIVACSHSAVASCLCIGSGEDAEWCRVGHASVITHQIISDLPPLAAKGRDTHANNSCWMMAEQSA